MILFEYHSRQPSNILVYEEIWYFPENCSGDVEELRDATFNSIDRWLEVFYQQGTASHMNA